MRFCERNGNEDGAVDKELFRLLRGHFLFVARHSRKAEKGSPLSQLFKRFDRRQACVHSESLQTSPIKIDYIRKQGNPKSPERRPNESTSPEIARSHIKYSKSMSDTKVLEIYNNEQAPPPLAVDDEAAADAALALCDAFVFARIGVFNMLATSVFNHASDVAERKVLSLAAVAARERWTCAALQEMPGKSEGVAVFRDLLRQRPAFARWEVEAGKHDVSWQGFEAPMFIFDRRCWEAVKKDGVAVAMLGHAIQRKAKRAAADTNKRVAADTSTAAAPGATAFAAGAMVVAEGAVDSVSDSDNDSDSDSDSDKKGDVTAASTEGAGAAAAGNNTAGAAAAAASEAEYLRRPGLLFLRSTAQPQRYLALVSVHARPHKKGSDPRDDALALSGSIAESVRKRAKELEVDEDSYVCIVAGDHNIGPPTIGSYPDPGDAFDGLLTAFEPVTFVDAAGAAVKAQPATNLPDFSVKPRRPRTYDHAFVSLGGAQSASVRASARVCDVAAAPFSLVADELAKFAAFAAQLANFKPCEPRVWLDVQALRDDAARRIKEMRKLAKIDHKQCFSDHKPLTVTLCYEPPTYLESEVSAEETVARRLFLDPNSHVDRVRGSRNGLKCVRYGHGAVGNSF